MRTSEFSAELPSGWDIRRLKTVAELRSSNVDKNRAEGERPVRLCNYTDVYYSDSIAEADGLMEATATEEEIRRFRLRRGDVLVTKDSETADDIAVPAFVARDFDDVLCGYHLAILRPRNGLDGRYLYYALLTDRVGDQFAIGANGITRFGLSQSVIKDAVVPLPPFPKQRAIAHFLDRETAKIDTLIEKKQRLLELLDGKRTALITRAVTRGLDPDVPMKDSGVEWIGKIPEHWDVVSVGRLARGFRAGKTPPTSEPAYYRDGSIPWFGPSSLDADLWIDEPGKLIHRSAVKEGVAPLMPPQTVLIQTIAEVGRVGVLTSEGSFNQQLTALTPRPQHLVSRFLAYFIHAFRDVLASWASTTTLPIISGGDLREFPIAVPPVGEQESITEALEAFDRDRSRIVSRTEQAISLVQEYRTALISAAVTGVVNIHEGSGGCF